MKKKKPTISRIGLIANPEKESSRRILRLAARLIREAGRECVTDASTAELGGLSVSIEPDVKTLANRTDLLLVLGGDGTILRVTREIEGARTPVLGINLGRLGFLTAVPSSELRPALEKIWEGKFRVAGRWLIEAVGDLHRQNVSLTALNDFVISRGAASRMIELEVRVDDQMLTRYRCDGLIVSSPTGSTAYSLSAGGAIVNPEADVFTITPICPHTLSNRSVITNLSSVIQVKVLSERLETILTADGQVQVELDANDVIQVRRSADRIFLVHLEGSSFFETVRRKLHWSGSNI